jgi:hypothetical protein
VEEGKAPGVWPLNTIISTVFLGSGLKKWLCPMKRVFAPQAWQALPAPEVDKY